MTTAFKRSVIAATIVLCGTISASATPYVFDDGGVGHDWDTQDNWNPPGRPGSGDTATIPNTFTCEIAIANQAVGTLQINTGGVLQIKGKDLTIYTGATVNGRLEFLKPSTSDPRLLIANNMTIDDSGTISASDADGLDPGIITHSGGTLKKLTIDGEYLTVKGSLTFLTHLNLTDEASLVVDDDDDEMVIGYLGSSPPEMELDGDPGTSYEVSAGTLKIGYTKNMNCESAWNVTGGTVEFSAAHATWLNAHHDVSVSGGTLAFKWHYRSYGELTFSGGTITVYKPWTVTWVEPEE